MSKYLHTYKIGFLHFLQYRFEILAGIISIFISLGIGLFFALAIYENRVEVYSYTLSAFVTYTLLSTIIKSVVDTNINWILSKQIRSGRLADFLVKPINYNLFRISTEASWKTQSLISYFFIFTIFIILYAKTFTLEIFFSRIPLFILALVMSMFLNRSFKFIIGVISFWSKDTGGISSFINQVIGALGGGWMPLEFLGIFSNFLKLLPFSYIFYFPIQILTVKALGNSQIATILLIELAWIVIFYMVGILLWKRGIKHFESVGI